MSYTRPEYSRSKVNQAGDILISNKATLAQLEEARTVLNNWRASHAYPLNTFNSTLRDRLKSSRMKAIVAQRLKRLISIENKLQKQKSMNLSRMQDIGGLRAIVSDIRNVKRLQKIYLSAKQFPHALASSDDYILRPKDDGYRSIHLIYKYKNALRPEYDGLQIELQIRTRLQHIWATAVETMGTYLGQALKSGQGEKKWKDFFAIVSSGFAYKEHTPVIPKFAHLNEKRTYTAIARIENSIRAIATMEGYNVSLNHIEHKGKGYSYHLIALDSLRNSVSIKSYARDGFKNATKDLAILETRAAEGATIEPVLVSAGDIASLKKAYPNYFGDVKDFISEVNAIVKANNS